MKLNVYEKRSIVKTYTTDTYDLLFGTVEDVLTIFDVDGLKTGSDVEILQMVGKALPKCIDTVKPLMKDIFEGLTDAELKNVRLKDIAVVMVEVVKYAFTQIGLGVNPKKM